MFRPKVDKHLCLCGCGLTTGIWSRNDFGRGRIWKCVFCGTKSGWHKEIHKRINIHADHIKPKARYPELVFDINNGRTLCESCHFKTDTWGGRTTFYEQRICSR